MWGENVGEDQDKYIGLLQVIKSMITGYHSDMSCQTSNSQVKKLFRFIFGMKRARKINKTKE